MAQKAGDPVDRAGTRSAARPPSISDVKAEISETRHRLSRNLDHTTERLRSVFSGDPADGSDRDRSRAAGAASGALEPLRLVLTALASVRSRPATALAGAVGAGVGLILVSSVRRRRRNAALDINRVSTILLDVDGTLIDSNGAHAETWAQALSENGLPCTAAQVRPLIGMGGDKLLPAIADVGEDSILGRAIAERKKALFAERVPQLVPTRGARGLVAYLRSAKKNVVVATSADEKEMMPLLERAGVADLIARRTSKDDAAESKPDPDIVRAALKRAGSRASRTWMIGDTPYDIEAARRAGVGTIALRCGGHWSDADLGDAVAIFDDPATLLGHWNAATRR